MPACLFPCLANTVDRSSGQPFISFKESSQYTGSLGSPGTYHVNQAAPKLT